MQEEDKKEKIRPLPLPAIGAHRPLDGFWVLPRAPLRMLGDPSNTSPSSALGTVIFTQKREVLTTAKATTFYNGDQ